MCSNCITVEWLGKLNYVVQVFVSFWIAWNWTNKVALWFRGVVLDLVDLLCLKVDWGNKTCLLACSLMTIFIYKFWKGLISSTYSGFKGSLAKIRLWASTILRINTSVLSKMSREEKWVVFLVYHAFCLWCFPLHLLLKRYPVWVAERMACVILIFIWHYIEATVTVGWSNVFALWLEVKVHKNFFISSPNMKETRCFPQILHIF